MTANCSGEPPALARLILVDVGWKRCEPEPESDIDPFVERLRHILRTTADGGHTAALHVCDSPPAEETDGSLSERTPQVAQEDPNSPFNPDSRWKYEAPPLDPCRHRELWLTVGTEVQQRIDKIPDELKTATPKRTRGMQHVGGGDIVFRSRVYLDSAAWRHATDCVGELPYHVVLDTRIQQLRPRNYSSSSEYVLITSFSVWSHAPHSPHYRMPSLPDPTENSGPLSPEDTRERLKEWVYGKMNARDAFRDLSDLGDTVAFNTFGRVYHPPAFVVAVLNPPSEKRLEEEALRTLSSRMLWTRNYEAVSSGLLKGGIKAYRRFVFRENLDMPRYLLVPDTEPLPGTGPSDPWWANQEEATASVVTSLSGLEAQTAKRLHVQEQQLGLLKNRVDMHEDVAGDAGTLWDALARVLPSRDRKGLATAHRSIELIHLTLVQGVADLDELVRDVGVCDSEVRAAAEDMTDRFDRELYHPSTEFDTNPLRASFSTGYVDRLLDNVRETAGTAARALQSYRMLLETIGLAFDERRVREGDQVQNLGTWIAVIFAVLGLSGVAQATAPLNPLSNQKSQAIIWSVRGGVWLAALVVVLAFLWQYRKLREVGKIASQEFEERYTSLRAFLAFISTDRLSRFSAGKGPFERLTDDRPNNVRSIEEWAEEDNGLCADFVKVWAGAFEQPSRTSEQQSGSNDEKELYDAPAALAERVENWALQALLLTERPKDFSWYQLPRLTCLYRVLSKSVIGSGRSAVSDTELRMVLGQCLGRFRDREPELIDKKAHDVNETLKDAMA